MSKKFFPVVCAVVLVLSGCGGADTSSPTTVPTADAASATSVPEIDGPAVTEIKVVVGTDSSPERREEVARGASVTLTVSNPVADDEFHLHGYDLSTGETERNSVAVLSFTADLTGEFTLESHETGEVLLVLVVS